MLRAAAILASRGLMARARLVMPVAEPFRVPGLDVVSQAELRRPVGECPTTEDIAWPLATDGGRHRRHPY
jgi:hypothetical protein